MNPLSSRNHDQSSEEVPRFELSKIRRTREKLVDAILVLGLLSAVLVSIHAGPWEWSTSPNTLNTYLWGAWSFGALIISGALWLALLASRRSEINCTNDLIEKIIATRSEELIASRSEELLAAQVRLNLLRDSTELKESAKRMSEFYSVVAHELRTPLTAIRGALGLIESNSVLPGSAEGAELIQVSRDSADRLIRLVSDIHDLQKIESGNFELHCEAIEINDLLQNAVQAMTGLAKEASVKLVYEQNVPGFVTADWDKSSQVLANLLSNSIKFSPAGGSVLINAVVENGWARVNIADHGPGIFEVHIHKFFGKFQQLDSPDGRLRGGSGLGLSIAKALVEQHGGNIGVDSGEGRGTTFWFELPLSSMTMCQV